MIEASAKEMVCQLYSQGEMTFAAICEQAGVTQQAVMRALGEDALFADAFANAERMRIILARDALFHRAVNGVTQGIYHQGARVDNKTVYSDSLLQFLLKAEDPARYGDRSKVEVHHEGHVELSGDALAEARAIGQAEGSVDALMKVAAMFADRSAEQDVEQGAIPAKTSAA